jgi:hypothetical protein
MSPGTLPLQFEESQPGSDDDGVLTARHWKQQVMAYAATGLSSCRFPPQNKATAATNSRAMQSVRATA